MIGGIDIGIGDTAVSIPFGQCALTMKWVLVNHAYFFPSMVTTPIQRLLEDIRLLSATNFEIVQAVRALAREVLGDVSEEVKYGGIVFSSPRAFGGVFAYKEHVTLELSRGADIDDALGWLEGAGKKRRHIKLTSLAQIAEKRLAEYLVLGRQATEKSD